MKNTVRIIIFFLFLISCVGVAAAKEKLTAEEKLSKGWIVRNISYGTDDSMVIVDVKALINASSADVWKLLSNIDSWPSWMPVLKRGWVLSGSVLSKIPENPEKADDVYKTVSSGGKGSVNISQSGQTSVTTFEEFDLPWPVNNDWVIRKYIFDAARGSEGNYKVSWKQKFKGAEGRGGMWEIVPNNGAENETLFKYHFVVKRKEGVPKAIFEAMVSKTIDRFISAIRRNVSSV